MLMIRSQMTGSMILIVVLICILFGLPACADSKDHRLAQSAPSQSKQELVVKLLEVTDVVNVSKQVMLIDMKIAAEDAMASLKATPGLTNEQKQDLIAFHGTLPDLVLQQLNPGPELQEIFSFVYDKYFDENDLEVMNSFYSHPSGQKYIKLIPKITQQSVERLRAIVKPKFESIMRKVMEEAIAKGLASKS